MQEVGASSLDEVILNWLRSEWSGLVYGTLSDRDIIDNADLGDAKENAGRRWLLRHRNVILDELPPEASACHVLIEDTDLPNLYIFPTGDWYLDTDGSFRLIDTAANLSARNSAHR
jgi:hypothetical protein